jgi:hypothetical protein
MSALAAPRTTRCRSAVFLFEGELVRKVRLTVANGSTVFAGGMVCLNASGLAVPASDAAGLSRVAGIAIDTIVGDGVRGVDVVFDSEFLLVAAASITQLDVGRLATVVDDQTLGDAAATTNDISVGLVREIVAGVGAWVFLPGVD